MCYPNCMEPIAIVRLILIGLLPPAAAVGFYFLEKTRFFGGLKKIWKQVIGGVVFGGICVLATEFGSPFNGAVLNVRDAAAVVAGLTFGLPGGVIAGLIGGLERFVSAYWNNTFYTQIACSISTFVSGLSAGLLSAFVFSKEKRPSWAHGLLVGLVTETFHMVMIFLTNANNPIQAFGVVRLLGNKMISANMLSSCFAMLLVQIIEFLQGDDKKILRRKKKGDRPIRGLLSLRLTVISVVMIAVSGALTYGLQSSSASRNTKSLLSLNVDDATADIEDTSDNNLLSMTRNVADIIEKNYGMYGTAPDDADLSVLLLSSGVSEIHYVNANGIVEASTEESSKGYDMKSGEQSMEFIDALKNYPSEYAQSYMETSQDSDVKKKYAGVALSFGGFVQTGLDTDRFYSSISEIVRQVVQNRHIGENGYMLVCDESFTIYSNFERFDGKSISDFGFPKEFKEDDELKMLQAKIGDVRSYYMFRSNEGFYIIGIVDVDEMLLNRDMTTWLGVYLEIIVFSGLFIMVYVSVDRLVLRDLVKVNDDLELIAQGDLNQRLDANKTDEMSGLSRSINKTVDSLKGYIELEATRYDEELRLGKQIQLSSLPSKVAYLRRHEFDIYGNMVTAKQVGGDFYDYFMLSDQKVAFMIADVSGKGIPAALFMMKTKSVLKALAENGLSVEDIFERANNRICEGNETDTFVTAWMGVCDLATGKLDYVNAGHNPPLARINGKYQYLDMKRDLVLGAMAGIPYKKQTIQLSPRDVIFLYTDGITEAESDPDCFFGEKRLLDLLNNGVSTRDPEFICKAVAEGVSAFVGDHDQSDDMTMVCFSYYGDSKDSHFEFEPTAEAVGDLCNRVSETLEESGLNLVLVNKVNLIVEEAAANIAFHAYEKKKGVGKLDVSISEAQIVLTFFDSGPAFNPLAKEDPDIHLSAEERPIGGLGIFMIKKLADKVYYSYQERQNILTVIINR